MFWLVDLKRLVSPDFTLAKRGCSYDHKQRVKPCQSRGKHVELVSNNLKVDQPDRF